MSSLRPLLEMNGSICGVSAQAKYAVVQAGDLEHMIWLLARLRGQRKSLIWLRVNNLSVGTINEASIDLAVGSQVLDAYEAI